MHYPPVYYTYVIYICSIFLYRQPACICLYCTPLAAVASAAIGPSLSVHVTVTVIALPLLLLSATILLFLSFLCVHMFSFPFLLLYIHIYCCYYTRSLLMYLHPVVALGLKESLRLADCRNTSTCTILITHCDSTTARTARHFTAIYTLACTLVQNSDNTYIHTKQ
jgi:hypothetical protein